MILVNLLPEEYRQKRRTPVKMLIAVSAAVAINTSLFAYWAWTAFGVAAEVSSELAVLEDTMQSLRPQIEYHETLQDESKLFQSREQTLADITSKRISWTEKVDQLVDVIHRGGSGEEKYLVWLDGLTVDTKINERTKTYGEVSANGNSGSPKFAQVANFLEDVQLSPLSLDFVVSSDPEGQQAIKDEELIPSEVWSFPFKLGLKSPEERAVARVEQALEAAQALKTSQDARKVQDAKDAKATQDAKDAKDAKATQDAKDAKATQDAKDAKDAQDAKDAKDAQDAQDAQAKAAQDAKGTQPGQGAKDAQGAKDGSGAGAAPAGAAGTEGQDDANDAKQPAPGASTPEAAPAAGDAEKETR